jgi:hypothetical protein
MSKQNYGIGLIGLDVKSSKQIKRIRRNHYRTPFMLRRIICLIAAASILGLFLLSGTR